jgi:hypothetical protein
MRSRILALTGAVAVVAAGLVALGAAPAVAASCPASPSNTSMTGAHDVRSAITVRAPGLPETLTVHLREGSQNGQNYEWGLITGATTPFDEGYLDITFNGKQSWIQCGATYIGATTSIVSGVYATRADPNFQMRACGRIWEDFSDHQDGCTAWY